MKPNLIDILVTGAVLCTAPVLGQNLIMNPSFEEYSVPCDSIVGLGDISSAFGWQTALRNYEFPSDLLSLCSIDGYNTPQNNYGYQKPKYGTNYAHFGFEAGGNNPNGILFSESVQPLLLQELRPGICYKMGFSLSLADYSGRDWDYGLEVYFSKEDLEVPAYQNPYITPHLDFGNQNSLSKTEWTVFEEQFFVTDTFKHMTIGWFTGQWVHGSHVYFASGYFIDNVFLYPCSTIIYEADAGADQVACIGDSIILWTTDGGNEYEYYWMNMFGDTISKSHSLTVQVTEDTEYYLSQWDFRYEQTWDTVRITLESCPELILPNVFSPNGDGVNELWTPIMYEVGELEVFIYSRWGQLVYQYSGGVEDFSGWDGSDAPEGMYYVVTKAVAFDGKVLEQKGSITLLR